MKIHSAFLNNFRRSQDTYTFDILIGNVQIRNMRYNASTSDVAIPPPVAKVSNAEALEMGETLYEVMEALFPYLDTRPEVDADLSMDILTPSMEGAA